MLNLFAVEAHKRLVLIMNPSGDGTPIDKQFTTVCKAMSVSTHYKTFSTKISSKIIL